jgi:hypothetical protein
MACAATAHGETPVGMLIRGGRAEVGAARAPGVGARSMLLCLVKRLNDISLIFFLCAAAAVVSGVGLLGCGQDRDGPLGVEGRLL